MSRLTVFNSPLMLGFEQLDAMFEEISKSSEDNYPPYNIEQIKQNSLVITVAVAGFSESDLSAYIENNQLVIKGKISNKNKEQDSVYIHRGIATRQFQKTFLLADGMKLINAKLSCGLLKITLERIPPVVKMTPIKIETDE